MNHSRTSDRISRRSLAKGAAWAAPAVTLTATVPAYAASKECTDADILTGIYSNGSFNPADYTYSISTSFTSADGTPSPLVANITTERTDPSVGLGIKNDTLKGYYRADGVRTQDIYARGTQETNMTLASKPCSGDPGIMLSQEPVLNEGQTLTFTFNAPVSDVQFSIYDVDQMDNRYADQVSVSAPNGQVSIMMTNPNHPVTVTGKNTSVATASADIGSGKDGSLGDCYHPMLVKVCAGPSSDLTSFTLTYKNTARPQVFTNQMILVGSLKVMPASCTSSQCTSKEWW